MPTYASTAYRHARTVILGSGRGRCPGTDGA
jgi:hypothetical protein